MNADITVSATQPIVTLREANGLWEPTLWYSNNTGFYDLEKHGTRDTAEKAAKQWAKIQNLVYVPPEGTFISVYNLLNVAPESSIPPIPMFLPCEVPLKGQVKGVSKHPYLDFISAAAEAKRVAQSQNKPCVPNFFLSDGSNGYVFVEEKPACEVHKNN